MTIIKVERSLQTIVHEFPPKDYVADKKNPKLAYALDFEVPCESFHPLKYYGVASGTVQMKSGKKIEVHGKSTKMPYVDCVIWGKMGLWKDTKSY